MTGYDSADRFSADYGPWRPFRSDRSTIAVPVPSAHASAAHECVLGSAMQGVLITHRAVVSTVAAQIDYLRLVGPTMGGGLGPDDVMLSYLPLAHIFDRCALRGGPHDSAPLWEAFEHNTTTEGFPCPMVALHRARALGELAIGPLVVSLLDGIHMPAFCEAPGCCLQTIQG